MRELCRPRTMIEDVRLLPRVCLPIYRYCYLIVLMILGIAAPTLHSFVIQPRGILLYQAPIMTLQRDGTRRSGAFIFANVNDEGNMSQIEDQLEIEELILSLSSITNDNSRRQQVSSLFQERQQQSIDNGESFMKLFDLAMVNVGDRVRMNVMNEVNAENRNELDRNNPNVNNEQESSTISQENSSPYESQLWACIDIMVQSKKLMKQARIK